MVAIPAPLVRATRSFERLIWLALRGADVELKHKLKQRQQMKAERFSFTNPLVCHYGYDMSKPWCVHFQFKDSLTGQAIRKQFRGGINHIKIKDERIRAANALKQFWKEKLEKGWNPVLLNTPDAVPIIPLLVPGLDRIFAIKKPSCRPKTVRSYEFIIRIFKDWLTTNHLENISLDELTTQYAQQYMDHLILSRKYAGRTHNDHLIVLRTFFNCMIDREWIARNPFRTVKRKPITVGRNTAYSEKEKELLRTTLQENDRRMYYLSQMIYHCFIRRTEIALVKVRDIDLVNKTIIIRAEISKNKTQESVVIPVGLDEMLKEMRLDRYNPEDYLFGKYLKTGPERYKVVDHITTRHNKIVKKMNIDPEKGLYSWKHTGVCDYYYATGKDVYSLMRQLRHRDLNTTMIYLKSLGLIHNDVFSNARVE